MEKQCLLTSWFAKSHLFIDQLCILAQWQVNLEYFHAKKIFYVLPFWFHFYQHLSAPLFFFLINFYPCWQNFNGHSEVSRLPFFSPSKSGVQL